MKRILQTVGAVVVAAMPHAALAFDADLSLDRFPSTRGTAVSDTREWRGGPEASRWDPVRSDRTGWHSGYRDDRREAGWGSPHHGRDGDRFRSHGSFIDVRTLGGAVERGSFYGTGGPSGSSVIVINAPDTVGPFASVSYGGLSGGPKILDVETDRLDRRPYGKDGLDVVHVGTAKIIRIAPDFRRGTAYETSEREPTACGTTGNAPTPFAELPRSEQAVTVYPDTDMVERPVDPPAPRVAETAPQPATAEPATAPAPAGFHEPWTPEWLRDCVARHDGFDASLGTYMAADGKRRFCTGEP